MDCSFPLLERGTQGDLENMYFKENQMLKKYPLAVTSLIIGLLSFLHLFGLEKAILAIVLGGLALKAVPAAEEKGKRYAYAGVALGSLYVIVLVVFMAIKGPDMLNLIGKLR